MSPSTCKKLFSFAFASALTVAAHAQFNVLSPTTDWVAIPYTATSVGDLSADHQTGQGEGDIVGNTGNPSTSLPSFYTKYVSGGSNTNGTVYYRLRVGGDQNPAGYKSVVLVGLDANKDGKIDLYLGVDNSGQSDGIYIWKPGHGLNISPSTTTVETKLPVKRYVAVGGTNYSWGTVTSASSTSGVALDPTANTSAKQDFNGATGTDCLLSFAIPFQDLVGALAAQGITYNSSSVTSYVMGTSTQANAFNQDINGINGGLSSPLTWGALGALTQPLDGSGNPVNTAPVNTVPTARIATGNLAIAGVLVADAEGNLATVRLTSTNGTVSVSLAGGAQVVAGTNSSASVTIGGTPVQINAALATLGYAPTNGYLGASTVTVLSTDSGGLTDSDVVSITVAAGVNTAPIALGDNAVTHAGKAVSTYVLGNDSDSNHNILTITGATLVTGTGSVSYQDGAITFVPATNYTGTATINYTISDGAGGTASAALVVVVTANLPPVVVNDLINANANATIFINVLANDTDGNGDALTITAASRTSGQGSVTVVGDQLQFVAPNNSGTTVLSYTISDGCGGTSTGSVTVTIGSNMAPVAVLDVAATSSGAFVDINALANDTDLNGDQLTISDAVVTTGSGTALVVNGKVRFTPTVGFVGVATVTYTIDDGRGGTASAVITVTVVGNIAPVATADNYATDEDTPLSVAAAGVLGNDSDANGNSLTAVLVSNPTNGALALNADGSFTYTPNANFNGADSFTYKANDGAADSNTVTVSITVNAVNDAPVATADSYSTSEDTALTINAPGIITNDTDVEGSALAASLVSTATNGTLSLNANGSFTYTPNANFHGTDSFTYRVSDGAANSNVATVTLTVTAVNDAPVAANNSYSTNEDVALTIAAPGVLGNDSDVDGDGLAVQSYSAPANGSLTVNGNGGFTYTPNANFNGTDSFTYVATDGFALSNTATVTLTVAAVNDAPVANNNSYSTNEDAALVIAAPGVLGNDTDVEGDALTASVITTTSNGTLVLQPNGSFTYTPNANFNGTDSFTYRANDGVANSNEATVTITVDPVNDAPVASNDTYDTSEDSVLTIAAPGVLGTDSDIEGTPLTAILVGHPANGSLTLNANGSFTYTPNANYHGTDSFTYRASDGSATSNLATVTINVASVNDAPVAVANSYDATEDTVLTISAPGVLGNDADADGNPLTAILVSSPYHGALSFNADGSFTYTPSSNYAGSDSFTYKANDGTVDSNAVTVAINVAAVDDAPVANHDSYTTSEDTALIVVAPGVLSNDMDVEGSSLTAVLVSSPSHGTLTLNADGSFTYTPEANYYGADSFTYRANDGGANSNVATVSLTVTSVEDMPVATNDTYTVAEDDILTVPAPGLLLNDSDPEGNTLTAIVVTGPSHGNLTLNADGSFSYVPAANYYGADSFTYKVNDGTADSNEAVVDFTVTSVNDAPVALADAYTVTAGTPLLVSAAGVLSNDTDVDGTPLTAVLVDGPTHGTLTLNADGSFSYTPATGYTGSDSFSYRANDGQITSDLVAVELTVAMANEAPVANNDTYTVVTGGTLIQSGAGVLANDTDAENSTLTASVVNNVTHGTLTLNTSGSFTYMPALGYTGPDSFTYVANDGGLNSNVATVAISVTAVNRVPTITTVSQLETLVGTPVKFSVGTSDPDGDLVVVTVSSPGHGAISGSGPYTYTPAAGYVGPDSFTVTGRDDHGHAMIRTVRVTVTPVPGLMGNYSLLLCDGGGEVRGHLVMTTTKLGRATGVVTVGGIRYILRGYFVGVRTTLYPRASRLGSVALELDLDQTNPTAPALLVGVTDAQGTYTGSTVRSPYSTSNHAPQAGKYTIIVSRDPRVIARSGAVLAEPSAAVPTVASVLTATVRTNGAVTFAGYSSPGHRLTCASYLMPGSQVPFYAGRRAPGASVQHSTFSFPDDPALVAVDPSEPAVHGTLRWIAGADLRLAAPLEAEYAVLGAHYTPPSNGAGLLGAPSMTLRLDVPTYEAAGQARIVEETRPFTGNLLMHTGGNISTVRVTLGSGAFIARIMGAVSRPIYGVVLQGEGMDQGFGTLLDIGGLGTCELLPATPSHP